MIGLGTMGRNFLLNVAEHGFSCIGYDLDSGKRELLVKEGAQWGIRSADETASFVAALETPRKIMLLVPAGKIVDSVIDGLLPHLEPGDIIIDGGNSHYTDTERRQAALTERKIDFLGVGVSGGEEGARHGASIMIGGDPAVYEHVRPMLEAASAKVDGKPCAAHVGKGSAGHFVKMVHNGIEYGMMQLIAETYDFMNRVLEMDAEAIADMFAAWNGGELNSFLIEITATVLSKPDAETGKPLVEMILDTAGQKGTGKWTSQAAMDLGVPVPTIDAAVTMRQISAQKSLRRKLAGIFSVDLTEHHTAIEPDDLKNALFCAFVIAYAQGMSLLAHASEEKSFGLDLAEIAKIWRGGCIIRSRLLENIRAAYTASSTLEGLLLDPYIGALLNEKSFAMRRIVSASNGHGIPAMCFASALNYFDSFRSERLPANLIQAQRDYFGAHTYQRIDKEGTFHTPDWDKIT